MIDVESTWIREIGYRNGYLAVFTHGTRGQLKAMLYAGVPSWVPGLVKAGTGRRSAGLAYNRLVKGQYEYRAVEGEKAEELREMML